MGNLKFALVLSFVLIPSVFSLSCYDCSSHLSWEECENFKKVVKCEPIMNTCIKAHRYFIRQNGQEIHEFHKACYHTSECSEESCVATDYRIKGSWCDFKCCNTTLCNTGRTPWAQKYLKQVGGNKNKGTFSTANQISVAVMPLVTLTLREMMF